MMYRGKTILMKAALMWTVNDFFAYKMFLVGTRMKNYHVHTIR